MAVDDGNLTAVERFLKVGSSMGVADTVTDLSQTAIHSCAHFGPAEIVEFLIDKGINVSPVERFGDGALYNVVMGTRPKGAMVTLLVKAGVEVKATRNSVTALRGAGGTGNVRMVQYLLDLGADTNTSEDQDGSRPAHAAAACSNGATVQCPLGVGQNFGVAGHSLHVAVEFGAIESVNVILEMRGDLSTANLAGLTTLECALYTHGDKPTAQRSLLGGGR